jgi:hypothetical protein
MNLGFTVPQLFEVAISYLAQNDKDSQYAHSPWIWRMLPVGANKIGYF